MAIRIEDYAAIGNCEMLALVGRDGCRYAEAGALFERFLSLCKDIGIFAEEYDVAAHRQAGNFPQAFSHLALINGARNLTPANAPVHKRSRDKTPVEPQAPPRPRANATDQVA